MAPPESSESPTTAGTITEPGQLEPNDRVIYPKQGICRVIGFETKDIAGQALRFVNLTREEDGASILVPHGKVATIGLRKLANAAELADVFELLASSFDDPELDWKVRHRTHGDLLIDGGVLGIAEVLKSLQALANLRPLPQKERERYDTARHLLVTELAVALEISPCGAEDAIDLALVPPPGTVRPASKPRKLATIVPRKPRIGARRGAGGSTFGDDELLLDDELPTEEEPAEAEAHDEEAEESAAPPPPAKRTKLKAKPATRAKAKPKAAAKPARRPTAAVAKAAKPKKAAASKTGTKASAGKAAAVSSTKKSTTKKSSAATKPPPRRKR